MFLVIFLMDVEEFVELGEIFFFFWFWEIVFKFLSCFFRVRMVFWYLVSVVVWIFCFCCLWLMEILLIFCKNEDKFEIKDY